MHSSHRISLILPTVKCSDCGENVQIHELGDHVCVDMPVLPLLPELLPQLKAQQPIPTGSMYGAHKHRPPPAPYATYATSTPTTPPLSLRQHEGRMSSSTDSSEGTLDILMADLMNSLGKESQESTMQRISLCGGCNRPITSNVTPIHALGSVYHPGHLKCSQCYKPVDNDKTGYKEYQQRVYCRSDYMRLFLPLCRACHLPVHGEAVSAMDGSLNGKWHVDCFGCHHCHEPFPDNTFYVFENSPYCRMHYHQLNNSLCRTCDAPIEGPCAQTTEGWRFHPPCFVCHVCHSSISDIYYMFERRIYCESHVDQLQQQHNVRAERRKTQFASV